MDIVGVMSGTSLDGLDLAYCSFSLEKGVWQYTIQAAETIPYSPFWTEQLSTAHRMSGEQLTRLDRDYGRYIGQCCNTFLQGRRADLIASHGHTVFHRPELHMTLQIGDGASIAAETGIRTVCDFRRADVAFGGQGAPLVPIGDELLFGTYTACLNLGGFANISFRKDGARQAFDIGPFNMVFNHYAQEAGHPYDDRGRLAAGGACCNALQKALDDLPFYRQQGPKSLGREWVEQAIYPLIDRFGLSPEDVMQTYTRHITRQIARSLPSAGPDDRPSLLVTGGGAYHDYAMDVLRALTPYRVVIPDSRTVQYKEALIFAFLGCLRILGLPNCLASVTGAPFDHCSGVMYEGRPSA